MYKVHCLNNISQKGLALLSSDYELTDDVSEADVILVRSANMHEMEFSDNLKAVARAGAGVNNIPLDALAERAAAISPNLRFADDLLDLCASCDYITIHVPATPKTKGMIGADEIAAMKEGVAFLNFSRDILVDNDAMRAGLTSGKVRRYVTDFATPEVMTMEGALVLPHLGASTAEAEENCAEMAVREVIDYLETGKKVHCVN